MSGTGPVEPVGPAETGDVHDVISDEEGRRVCSARLTCLLRDVRPGDGAPVGATG